MQAYVLRLDEIDSTMRMDVGGKAVHLAECFRIEGLRVPEGFCVTTKAYRRMFDANRELQDLFNHLSTLSLEDRNAIQTLSRQIRETMESIAMVPEVKDAITQALSRFGEERAYAIRSSATAEDLPHASFAGQQDSYLNIKGREAILQHIQKCWASLFTDRAVVYRMQNGFDHRNVYLSVIVQHMVLSQISGIVFTADPLTSNRKVLTIDASFGLGEGLVSGRVSADHYQVQEGKIIKKVVADKKTSLLPGVEGGIQKDTVASERQYRQALTDAQILKSEKIGRKLESHFSYPQDIEWCMVNDTFHVVQSRPITTLFPIPDGGDKANRVYLSMGHQQMMTEAIRPLGISFFRYLSDDVPMLEAGGRLYVDLSHDLASPIGRQILMRTIGINDPSMRSALTELLKRKGFIRSLPRGKRAFRLGTDRLSWGMILQAIRIYRNNDETIVPRLMAENEAAINRLKQRIKGISGKELFSFIHEDFKELKRMLFYPRSLGVIAVAIYASNWINKQMDKWLGEKNAADVLSQSVPHNVTSEMGLALLDVADVVRQYPAVMAYFTHARDHTFFDDLSRLEGGAAVGATIQAFLSKYGMRCTGEIDITKPRWREKPTALIPLILNNIRIHDRHARQTLFEQGRLEAERKEKDLLSRLQALPGGGRKAKKAQRMIRLLRNFIGYREYPKYTFIQRYDIYKEALLREAEGLVQQGILREKTDVYYLTFEEFWKVVRTGQLEDGIISQRRAAHAAYEKLTPPRIITSEGESIAGIHQNANIPSDALAGVGVSSGIIEGRARVIHRLDEASVEDGDILVTAFTDPSWTPLFISIKGLVTEVGGLMTHGSVIAREYGLPAVVGVDLATKRIPDGQRIRVNGTDGYVELIE
jgi:phosphoenolpyruvate synthase/pyruvate phosphate dikinase